MHEDEPAKEYESFLSRIISSWPFLNASKVGYAGTSSLRRSRHSNFNRKPQPEGLKDSTLVKVVVYEAHDRSPIDMKRHILKKT